MLVFVDMEKLATLARQGKDLPIGQFKNGAGEVRA